MTVIQRYTYTGRGYIDIIGNTLGLAGSTSGLVGGIRNFTTSLPNPPSGGTTTDYKLNGSSAFLTLPTGTSVLYAELVWGGFYQNTATGVDLTAHIDDNINLTDPTGTSNSVSITPATSQQSLSDGYVRTADVTAIVKAAGGGKYTATGVVGVLTGTSTGGNADNLFCGWSMYVVIADPTATYKNMTIWSCFEVWGTSVITVTGFSTPTSGTPKGRLFISAGEGNANLTGDQLRFGPDGAHLTALSTPSNPSSNFFPGIICDRTGNVNKTGTWGNVNNTAGSTPAQGNRSMYDLTGADVSSTLQHSQNSAAISIYSTGDGIIAHILGLEVEVNSPSLVPMDNTVNKNFTNTGDTLTYTTSFTNTGLGSALSAMYINTLPAGMTYVPNSFTVDGVTIVGANLQAPGVSIGDIIQNRRVTINFKATVTTVPNNFPQISTIPNMANITYTFVSAPNTPTLAAGDISSVAYTQLLRADLSQTKTVDRLFADINNQISYSIPIRNNGSATANNILFIDTIPEGTSLVANSFKQDTTIIATSPNPPGVTLPNSINPMSISTITFKVTVNTIPSSNKALNSATTKYTYTTYTTITNGFSDNTSSNIVTTTINNASFIGITKYVDKTSSYVGDIITYTIVAPNSGNATAVNIIFRDTIPNGTTFITDSVIVNGTTISGISPATGITLPNMGPGGIGTITYKLLIG